MLREGPMIDAHRVTLAAEDDFDGWRDAARDLAEAGVPPGAVVWLVDGGPGDLFSVEGVQPQGASFAVPRTFIDLAKSAVCHSDPERFALLYALLWKLRTNRAAMEDRADPLLHRIDRLAKEVRRDVHKMHAFIRFREVEQPDGSTRFIAFFEPEHHIVRHTAGFFVRRFSNMRWSILTPELSIHWDGETLTEGPGAVRADAPGGDPLEAMWKTYYASIFNPARLKVGAMLKEMPKKYWRNMPETSLVQPLIASARARELEMIDRAAAKSGLKNALEAEHRVEPGGNLRASWDALIKEARGCNRCDLYKHATQTVFGEGPWMRDRIRWRAARRPGGLGRSPVRRACGPGVRRRARESRNCSLGRLRHQCGQALQVRAERQEAHPQQAGRGRDRGLPLVDRPGARADRPPITVALGATAARSIFDKVVTIGRVRGSPLPLADGGECWMTVHPSFLLRIPEPDRRTEERGRFVDDLKRIRDRAEELAR